MRIISGTARGKRLASFSGNTIRPTSDRVREAVFSILYSKTQGFSGMKVLDLFAGSGAMALEALSRGAASAVLVDEGAQAASVISTNIEACSQQERATHLRANALKALPRLASSGPFDLIFLDPPYGKGLLQASLQGIAAAGLLAPEGILCAESSQQEVLPETFGDLVLEDRRRYGSTAVHFYVHPRREEENDR